MTLLSCFLEAVTLKLSTFWTTCPLAWFGQTEAQFSLRNISSDDTKYYYVVAALDANTATRALSIISSPPAEQKYELLKSFLTSAFGISEPQRANGLGDRKPSELLDLMLTLLEDHKPCFIFKQIFLRQLPEKLRVPLTNSPHKTDLIMLALEVDNLLTSLGSSPEFQCSQIQSANTDAIETNSICWYHRRFGTNAQRCDRSGKHYSGFIKKTTQGNAKAGRR